MGVGGGGGFCIVGFGWFFFGGGGWWNGVDKGCGGEEEDVEEDWGVWVEGYWEEEGVDVEEVVDYEVEGGIGFEEGLVGLEDGLEEGYYLEVLLC